MEWKRWQHANSSIGERCCTRLFSALGLASATSQLDRNALQCIALREIGGKTHTFWFDWGPTGEPDVVGIRTLAQKPLLYKVNGIVFSLRKSVLLDVDVLCIRWLFFCFASIFRKKKEQKRSKYRLLWQLNFYPGHHKPVDCHWPPVKSSSFTKTAQKKVPFSWGWWGGIQFHSIGFSERHI